jgi:phosphoribosylamine--glycine ligase
MNVLLIGSGGASMRWPGSWRNRRRLGKLFAAPGNPGIAEHAELVAIDPADHRAVVDFCLKNSIGAGRDRPGAPLVDGLADNLRTMGFCVFGPNRRPAQLEGSKGFTKDLCAAHGIPTARYARAPTAGGRGGAGDFRPAGGDQGGRARRRQGRGHRRDARSGGGARAMFAGGFGAAGARGDRGVPGGRGSELLRAHRRRDVVPFGSAQDHKRVGDGDTGPNTGGMGAYSPPHPDARAGARVMARSSSRRCGRWREGTPYSGVLYAGLMLTAEGPKLIEYNARFGDPECQVLMMRLESDLLELMLATAEGRLAEAEPPRFCGTRRR